MGRDRAFRMLMAFVAMIALLSVSAQQAKPGVLSADEIKRLVPSSYFFAGQSAPVQVRNSVGFRTSKGKLVMAGLMDTSGYASDIAQKYQGFLITETKLNIEGSAIAPGEYGFGFAKDGKFMVMDVAANELLGVSAKTDDNDAHPVPLKMVANGNAYKLYAGKKWVGLKAE